MRHNQDNDYDHRNDREYDRGEEERERRRREEQRWHEDPRNRRPEGRQQNYAQDRWPDFQESYDSIKNHGRPENLQRRDRDDYANRYHMDDRDPRYLDEEMRERRERMRDGGERHQHPGRNQFASDRWPDEENTYEHRTRSAGDDRYREGRDDRDRYRQYYQDRDHDRDPGR